MPGSGEEKQIAPQNNNLLTKKFPAKHICGRKSNIFSIVLLYTNQVTETVFRIEFDPFCVNTPCAHFADAKGNYFFAPKKCVFLLQLYFTIPPKIVCAFFRYLASFFIRIQGLTKKNINTLPFFLRSQIRSLLKNHCVFSIKNLILRHPSLCKRDPTGFNHENTLANINNVSHTQIWRVRIARKDILQYFADSSKHTFLSLWLGR